jgi:uncharacterized protein (DUF433 family)
MHPAEELVFDTAVYGYAQAAQYVGVPEQTLRRWAGEDGLIVPSGADALSFNNLAEAHILKAMRRKHGLALQGIRKALKELGETRRSAHPLLAEEFETDGVDLCIRDTDAVINLSRRSQREFREFVSLYLHRIERDKSGRVAYFYPFIVAEKSNEPKSVSINPTISFGRPVLAGTGISTSVIAGRFGARDSIEDLAREYGVSPAVLEDAIRWEMNKGKAA